MTLLVPELAPSDFWALPGPRGFRSDVEAALSEHSWLQQVVVAAPRDGPAGSLGDQLVSVDTPRRVLKACVDSDVRDNVPALMLSAGGRPLPPRVATVGDVVSGSLDGCLVVLDALHATATQLDEVEEVVLAAAASAHNAGPGEFPVQIVAVVPGAVFAHLADGPRLAVRWWWGRLSPLDTALLLRDFDRALEELRTSQIVEVATFDLRLALLLAEQWDGDLATLGGALAAYGAAVPRLRLGAQPQGSAATDRPPAQAISSWDVGACDRWGPRRFEWHAVPASQADSTCLTRAVWRAQAANVLPVVEEHRERIVGWLRRRGYRTALDEYDDPIEIGDVYRFMRGNRLRWTPQYDLVEWLWNARNEVAHLRCVTAGDWARGQALIEGTSLY